VPNLIREHKQRGEANDVLPQKLPADQMRRLFGTFQLANSEPSEAKKTWERKNERFPDKQSKRARRK